MDEKIDRKREIVDDARRMKWKKKSDEGGPGKQSKLRKRRERWALWRARMGLSNYTCDKQEMRPDISRWHGEDRLLSRSPQSVDILSLTVWGPCANGQQQQKQEPHRKCNDQSLIPDDGTHVLLSLFLSLSLLIFVEKNNRLNRCFMYSI